ERCVARVRRGDYLKSPFQLHDPLARWVDMVMNPDHLAALELARLVKVPAATYVDYFADGCVTLIRLKVVPGTPITEGPLREVQPKTCVVVGVVRDADVLIPDGDTRIEAGDRVLLMGPTAQAHAIRSLVTPNSGRIRNVLVAGGGRIAEALLGILLPKDRRALRITVVEKDGSRCRRRGEQRARGHVIRGG